MILKFLELPWEESVLHHQDHINKDGDSGIRYKTSILNLLNALSDVSGFVLKQILHAVSEINYLNIH